MASADRQAGAAALSASASELAVLSRDISLLTQLLRTGEYQRAHAYRERLETLDADVRRHLDFAAATLAELLPPRPGTRRANILHTTQPGSCT